MRIDAHQHFWKFDPIRDNWIGDDMQAIRQDFLPQHLEPILQQHHFDGCVLVQSDQSEEGNHYLLTLAAANDFIKGIIGWVDLQADNIEERLAYYQQYPVLKGFRHVLQGELDRALMLKPSFKSGIAALSKFNYTYDILIFPDQLQYVKELATLFPDQPFVLDHLAKPYIKSGKIGEWQDDITAIAQYPNIYCKLSGMVTEADWLNWQQKDFTPYLDVVVEAFGTDRLMYGSDWPVCLLAATYSQTLQLVEDYFAPFSEAEKAAIFGGNAVRFYKLK